MALLSNTPGHISAAIPTWPCNRILTNRSSRHLNSRLHGRNFSFKRSPSNQLVGLTSYKEYNNTEKRPDGIITRPPSYILQSYTQQQPEHKSAWNKIDSLGCSSRGPQVLPGRSLFVFKKSSKIFKLHTEIDLSSCQKKSAKVVSKCVSTSVCMNRPDRPETGSYRQKFGQRKVDYQIDWLFLSPFEL